MPATEGPVTRGNAPTAPPADARLLVAADGSRTDAAVLTWVAEHVDPRDRVHVVHAYAGDDERRGARPGPRAYRATSTRRVAEAWRPVVRAEAALQTSQRTGSPRCEVGGAALAGDAADVLVELSTAADLLVLGADHRTRMGPGVAVRVREAARCPVVLVPRGWRPEADRRAPVTVLLDRPSLPRGALDLAHHEAVSGGVGLRVVQLRSALRWSGAPSPQLLAEEQVQLDASLQDWDGSATSVGLVAEISLADPAVSVHAALAHSRLVVASASAAPLLPAGVGLLCPVATVPQ
jgi:hypothetical protein